MTQQSTSVRCPSVVNCSGSRFEHIHVQQQLVSSTASPGDDVHVLLKLISVAATHTRDEGKKCLVSAALSRSTFSPSLPIKVVEHTSDARNLFIAKLLRRSLVIRRKRDKVSFRMCDFVLRRVSRRSKSTYSQRARKIQSWNMPKWSVEHVDAKLVNAWFRARR